MFPSIGCDHETLLQTSRADFAFRAELVQIAKMGPFARQKSQVRFYVLIALREGQDLVNEKLGEFLTSEEAVKACMAHPITLAALGKSL